MSKSSDVFNEALKYMPGGVNSPVRAFNAVNDIPRFIKKADGCYIYDIDNNKYVDYICSWGPIILGHNNEYVYNSVSEAIKNGLSYGAATEIEVEMAKLICDIVPSVEMVRMVNSGTEAVMSAIRLARGFTGRNKIIKFEGCYHGHSDTMLVKAGSGVMTGGLPGSLGVTKGCTEDTLIAVYNDIKSVENLFNCFSNDIAAVIIEPVAANMGVVIPEENFLKQIRQICDNNNSLLIFDEVITGFRIQIDGAQGYFGVKPDITTFGKIIGGGMPVGAYGGRRDIMELVSPCGGVYQAGTLSGNPIAMAAGITQLKILNENPEIYDNINKIGDKFFNGIRDIMEESKKNYAVNNIGSIGSLFFISENVCNYSTAKMSNTNEYAKYFKFMLKNGFYFAPSQFEAIFISNCHTELVIENTLKTIEKYFTKEVKSVI